MKNRFLLFLAAASMLLTGCKGGVKCKKDVGNDLLETPLTDSLKFAQADQLEGKKFASTEEDDSKYDHYGLVTLRSVTDGDTANFVQDGYVDDANKPITIKTRFLGVNTPESTAKIEPWGKKASLFTKHILEEAQADADKNNTKNIALITDPAVHGTRDSSGNRWLAFVWYRPTSTSQWRCLNLEIVEQCYSKNQLFKDSKMCDYRSSFEKANDRGEKCGYRVFGADDVDFDYTTTTYEYSLWGINKHYDEIGISESGSSGVQLIVTALVVGIQGDNLYLRDLLIDEEQYQEEGENARLAGCYAYAGYNSSLCSTLQTASKMYEMDGTGVGLVIRFFCRATKYSDNIQLSGLETSTTGKKALRIIVAKNFDSYKESFSWSHIHNTKGEVKYEDISTSVTPVTGFADKISKDNKDESCKYKDLLPYVGQWVQLDMEVRAVTPKDDDDKEENSSIISNRGEQAYWFNPSTDSKSSAYTVYAKFAGKDGDIFCNIRINDGLNPDVTKSFWGTDDRYEVTGERTPVGHKWKVTGYLSRYFEGFQLQLGNNYSEYNYLQYIG